MGVGGDSNPDLKSRGYFKTNTFTILILFWCLFAMLDSALLISFYICKNVNEKM